MIFDPDAFANDWYGYLTNQAGHSYLVGAPLVLALSPWFGIAAPVAVGVGYGLIWEIGIQRGRLWRDSFEDTVHVTTGAAVIASALTGSHVAAAICLAAQGALLAIGIWRRVWR